jgi:hypothetical protein
MIPVISWSLAAATLAAGWFGGGWQGMVLAVTAIVFWLLPQFRRALRAMRKAGSAPPGRVASEVLLRSMLREGMTLVQGLALTGSLGERVAPPAVGAEESWRCAARR